MWSFDMTAAPEEAIVAYKGPHGEKYVYTAFRQDGEWVLSFQTGRVTPYAWQPKPEAP